MGRIMLVLIMSVLVVGQAEARTWHVDKDGSGDFTVIQDAVDAASPGDTIRIHAGRYEEMVEDFDMWGDGSFLANPHIAVTKDNLSFIGDGSDVTIVGPVARPTDPPSLYSGLCVTDVYASGTRISDLAVESTNYGLILASITAEVNSVRFQGTIDGIRDIAPGACVIDWCEFRDCGTGVKSHSPAANLSIRNSEFTECGTAYLGSGTTNAIIEDCTAMDTHSGFNIQQGSSAVLRRVVLQGYVATGLGISSGATVEVYDSTFQGGITGIYSYGESLWCERTRISGQTAHLVYVNSNGETVLQNCDLISGGGVSVECRYNGSSDCHVTMTNCYWGTESEEQIAEWIIDSEDHPERCCTVDFIPFRSESTPAEAHSWSSVKGLFESGGEE